MLTIQILKTSIPSIIINAHNKIYIFNVPEGFQRYIADYGIRLKASPKIFFTKFTPLFANGIIGLLLTLNFDKMITDTKLYGPKGLCDFIEASRLNELGGFGLWHAECNEFNRKLTIWKQDEEEINKKIKFDNLGAFEDDILKVIPIFYDDTISYHVIIKSQKGKINPQKLEELKLTKDQRIELFVKQEITLNGTLQKVEYLMDPDIPEQHILILDNAYHISLIDKSIEYSFIYHLSELDQFTEEYEQFIAQQKCQHIFCCQETMNEYTTELPRAKYLCNLLHQQFPHYFPYIPTKQTINKFQGQNYEVFQQNVLLPLKQKGFSRLKQIAIPSQIKKIEFEQNQINHVSQVKITFLGTASMKPNKYRNVSGIYLSYQDKSILLDCGEGTLGQLQDEQILNVEQRPLLIWISHVHSDHNLGLVSFLYFFSNVYLMVPAIMVPWISVVKNTFKIKNNFKIVVIQQEANLKEEYSKQNQVYDENLLFASVQDVEKVFDIKIKTCPVVHCAQAFAIRLDFNEGTSLSYSGDTRPCQSFIELSKNVDLMIHEATFTDDMQDKAIQRNHATTREAVESAIESDCKSLLLTHFSQRFTKQPPIQVDNYNVQIRTYLENRTSFALDHLSAYLDQFAHLSQFTQVLQNLFL